MNSWDDEFGHWRGLASPSQAPRYLEIAGLIAQLCPEGSVIDVGCGEAVLRDYLPQALTYLGIEPSAKAVASARAKCGSDSIVHTTAECFEAGDRRWDCIVFNEILYYLSDPAIVLDKYAKLLKPEGIIIVSIFQKVGGTSIKARLIDWFGNRRMTNAYCTEIVKHFIVRHAWLIDVHKSIARPGGTEQWTIWVTKPQVSVRGSSTVAPARIANELT